MCYVAEFLVDLKDQSLLQHTFNAIRLPWLRVGLCQQLLDTLDDNLLVYNSTSEKQPLSLSFIVSFYKFIHNTIEQYINTYTNLQTINKRTHHYQYIIIYFHKYTCRSKLHHCTPLHATYKAWCTVNESIKK